MASPLLTLLLTLGLEASPAPAEPPPEVTLPFACGRSYVVSQAHEEGSHVKYDAFAWDFRMPSGEPIVAALDGVIRAARGDSTTGGCDPSFARQANYVVVSHESGLETQYLHFSKVVVAKGQKVKAGELLGYSGRTGWACGAHLHFKVARTESAGWNNPSVPARLSGYGDPATGERLESPACTAERPHLASLPEAGAIDLIREMLGPAAAPDAGIVAVDQPASGASAP